MSGMMGKSWIHGGFDHCPVLYFVLTRKYGGEGMPELILKTEDKAEAERKRRELEEEDPDSIHRVETYTVIDKSKGYNG